MTFKAEFKDGKLNTHEDRLGCFHGFHSEDTEINPGHCVRVIKAVVEFEDGTVDSFDCKHFKFLFPTDISIGECSCAKSATQK